MGPTEKSGEQYVYSSPPTVPGERTPDILVRFQAVSRERSCVRQSSVYLSSRSSLLQIRKIIHRTFAPCFEKGFIFLRKNKEVLRSRERIIRLFDILPRPPPNVHNPVFKYPNVQYKRLSYDKSGRRYTSLCCGLVFLCEDSGLSHWIPDTLNMELSAPTLVGFDFIPSGITSARQEPDEISVDAINQLAATGKLQELSTLLKTLPDDLESRHIKDSRCAAPLHYAAQNGHLEVCELLIGRFGREMLYTKDINRQTPLHCALTYGKFEESGFEQRKENEDGRLTSKLDVVSYLLQLGPDLYSQDNHGINCYRILFTLGNTALDELLQRTDLSLLDDRLILHLTCYVLQYKKMEYAKELCKIVKVFDPKFYRPPLHLAAEIGDEELVELLVNRTVNDTGAGNEEQDGEEGQISQKKPEQHDPRDKDLDGHLSFHYACQHGRDAVLSLLYFEEMSNEDFIKGIFLAVKWKKTDVLQTIIKLRDLFFLDDKTKHMIVQVIENNLPKNSKYARSLMPLLTSEKIVLIRFASQACRLGDIEALKLIADLGADIQQADMMGRTPFHEAAEAGNIECVEHLLERNIDPNVRDWRGSTPLHYACIAGRQEAVNMLLQCQAVVSNVQDKCGRTPLLAAAHSRQRQMLKFLITNYASTVDVHAEDSEGRSVLHYLYLMDVDTAENLLEAFKSSSKILPRKVQDTEQPSFVTVCQIWRDQGLELKEKRRKLRKMSLKCARMQCKQCGKVWTILGNRVRWRHICKLEDETATDEASQNASRKQSKKKPVLSKPAFCEEISTIQSPFEPFEKHDNQKNASSIDNLLLEDRADLLKSVLDTYPELLQNQEIQHLHKAAFRWSAGCLGTLVSHLNPTVDELTKVLHAACLQKASNENDIKRQLEAVGYLLKEGAFPNHIPKKGEIEILDQVSCERNILYFCPLELAVIHGNIGLAELLLKEGASSSICFAPHLAILNGDYAMLGHLLKGRKENDESIIGVIHDVDEHWRVCSLGMGLLQALGASEKIDMKLLQCVLTLAPDALQSKKIVTKNMISEIRPDLDVLSPHCPLGNILVTNSLPLSWPLKKNKVDHEPVIIELVQRGVYLDEVRVSKKSTIHAACDLFTSAVSNKCWKLCEEILHRGGDILWKCILSKHHSCHKHTYKEDMGDTSDVKTYPILFESWWRLFNKAPLTTLRKFFQEGKTSLEDSEHEKLKKKMYPLLKDTSYKDQMKSEHILTQVVSHHASIYMSKLQKDKFARNDLSLPLVRLLILFPKLISQILDETSVGRILDAWIYKVTRSDVADAFKTYKKWSRAIKTLRDFTADRKLLLQFAKLEEKEFRSVGKSGDSLLHFVCLLDDVQLVQAVLDAIDPLDVNTVDDVGASPLDYAVAMGNETTVAYLLKADACVTQITLLASCAGTKLLPYMKWRHCYSQRITQEEHRLKLLRDLSQSLQFDASYIHPKYGNLLNVAVQGRHWMIVEFLLQHGNNISVKSLSERSTILPLFMKAPSTALDVLLENHGDALKFESGHLAQEVMFAASTRSKGSIALTLLKTLLKDDTDTVIALDCFHLLSWHNKHGMTVIHNAAQLGHFDLLKFVLDVLGKLEYSSIEHILNKEGDTKTTPVWYAIANSHWKTARLLLLHGGLLPERRAIPNFSPRRMFTHDDNVPRGYPLRSFQDTQIQRNESTNVAECISPKSKTFKEAYVKRVKSLPKKSKEPAKHVPQVIPFDKEKQAIKYLICLSQYCRSTSSRMIHAAAAVGDVDLLQEILALPMATSLLESNDVPSPLDFALANHQFKTFEILVRKIPVVSANTFDHLTLAILEASGFEMEKRELKKVKLKTEDIALKSLLDHVTSIEDTFTDFHKQKHFIGTGTKMDEGSITLVMRSVLNNLKGPLNENLVIALAYMGKVGPLQVLEKCDSEELNTLFTKNLLSNLSFIDLLFIFTKQICYRDSMVITQRTSVLDYLSKQIDIKLHDDTFDFAMRRALFPMLISAFEDLVRKDRTQESTEKWMEALYLSSKQGDIDLVKVFVEEGNQQLLPDWPVGLCKAVCLACLHKRREAAIYLLQTNQNLKQEVTNLTVLNRGKWILDFAVLSSRADIVQDVLVALDQSGVIDSFALRGSMELAAEHGNEAVMETLMQSRMITSVLTKDFLETLLLKAAARGHQAVSLALLKSRYLDVRRTDEQDNSCLHYASLWNMMDLAIAVLKDSRDEIRSKNKDSYNPLDLARCMGNVKISNLLVETHKATPSHEFSLLYTGWLRHLLTKNEPGSQEYRDIMPRHSHKRRYKFSLLTMLQTSDDLGSLALIETANETLIELMKASYDKLQFIFLSAKYGCYESLKGIISLIKQFAPEKLEEWLKGSEKPPLAVALENRHILCAEILIAEGKCFSWTSNVFENILHVAARFGNEALTEEIASGAPTDLFSAKDKSGLVPAATAISFGHHHLLRFLCKEVTFDEEEHSQHQEAINYTCVLCLMDLTIGWSKTFQGSVNRHVNNWDICNRKPLNAYRGPFADWCVLTDVYAWRTLSTAPLFAALYSMGYREDIVTAQIMLLKTNVGMIQEALKAHYTEAACFLFETHGDQSEEDVHQLCLYAAQSGQNEFIKTVLQKKSYDELMSDGMPSILEVAHAYGNTELLFDLQQMDVQDDFDNLRNILPEALPTFTKWSTGLSHPGDEEWKSSMHDTSKMSLADVLLSSPAADNYRNTTERNASVSTMIPSTYLGKELTVDVASFEASAPTFSDVRARALVMSRLVVGRYDTDIDMESEAWKSVSKINVVCIPKDSLDKPEVVLKGAELREKVKISIAESGKGYQVTTGAMPSALTEEASLRRYIEESVREEVIDLIKQELPGLDIKITVDWDSLKVLKDKEQLLTILKILSGDISSNKLAGLQGTILKCGSILRDIEYLCGKKASYASKKLLSNCSEIVVKYAQGLPIMKSNALIPKESVLVWHFTLKDSGLHYNTDHFPPLKILHLCHVGYSSFHQCLIRILSKPDESKPTSDMKKLQTTSKLRYQAVTATIDWDSFDTIGMSGKLDIFIRKYAVPELQKIVVMYESMPWLHLDVDDVCLRVTRMKDRSGLWLKKRTLVVSLKVTQTDTGEWVTEFVDCSKFFMLQEEKQILEQMPRQTYEYPHTHKDVKWPKSSKAESLTSSEKIAKATDNLQNQLGITFMIKKNDTEWLRVIHKDDFREMSHPLHLIGRYIDHLANESWFRFSNTVLKALERSRSCVYIGTFEVPAGAWSWATPEELKGVRGSKIILVMVKTPAEPQNTFQTMKVSDLKDLGFANVKGIWKHVSFNKLMADQRPTKGIQLASINRHLLFVCDIAAFKCFLEVIPNSIDLKPKRDDFKKPTLNDRELAVSSNDLATYDGYFHRKQCICPRKELIQAVVFSKFNNISAVWEVWETSMRIGTNIMIDIDEFDDDLSLELVGYVMKLTLYEIEGHYKRMENYGDAVISAFNDIDMIRVGFQHSEKGEGRIEKVEGSKYSDLADISLLPGAVLRINFKDSILDEDRELKPITDTLISAICCSFEIQTPFLMAETLFDNLKNHMTPQDVSVFSFHTRKDKETVLSAAVKSRDNFFKAVKAIREKSEESERHRNAKEKLSELSKLQFKDRCYQDGSVVGYNNGDMKYWVFKSDGDVASSEEIEDDLLDALEGRDSNQKDRYTTSDNGYSLPLLQTEDLFPDNQSVLTVSSPTKVKRDIPRIDRLRRPHATSRLAIQKANERLFDFVEIGHTGNIDNVLDVGANINSKDEEGRTPLIRAAELRNYVLQRMLLSRGADANKSDKIGRTALHFEAAHGDVESIKLFLTHGSKVNAKDWNGRTPLHYSVNRRQLEAVDILVFCGADVTIKDKLGHTPAYQSRSPELNRLMQESRQTVFGIKNGYVFIEHAKLEAESTYYLKTLGLTIKTPPSIGTGAVDFISRRVRPEYSRSSLTPTNKELLLSDVFEYRLSGTRPEGHVTMKIPVYAKPDLFEEAYMKTDKGVYSGVIRDFRYEEDKKEWFCYVKMNISNINAFLLVTLPKVEKFPITPEGGVFTSNVDNLVEIRVQKDTFTKSGTLTLEVIPKPAFDEPEFNPVLSLSHFYDVNHSKGEQPHRDVDFTMPIPQDYFGDGDLYVMLRHEEDGVMEEERWEILEKNPQIRNGLISVGVPHFSDVNVIEYAVPNQDVPVKDQDVIKTNAKLLEKAKRRECSVVFMAMLRPAEDSQFEAMVECTRNTRLYNRLHHWKTEGYKDQNPSYTNEFITFPKQEFNFDIGGNSQKVNNVTTKLQYHPKRDNFLKFPICVKDEKESKVGSVDIGEKERLEKQFVEHPNYSSLARILVYLAEGEWKKSVVNGESLEQEELEEAKAFEGFTDKVLLQKLAAGMGPEWLRIGILLGFPRASLEKLKAEEDLEEEEKRLKMLTRWRDRRLHRSDHGVPELLIALQKCGRSDLVSLVITELKRWLDDKTERRDKFYSWLERVLTNSTLQITGLLEPMSDDFLQALVTETGVVLDLAGDIDVSKPEVLDIQADPLAPTDQGKMMKILQTCREKQDSRALSFRVLTEGLTTHGMIQARNWMIRTAREWINNTELSDDPFIHAINDYLEEAEVTYKKKSRDNRDEETENLDLYSDEDN